MQIRVLQKGVDGLNFDHDLKKICGWNSGIEQERRGKRMEMGRRGYTVLYCISCSVVAVMVSWSLCAAHYRENHFNHTLHIEAIEESDSCGICHLGENRTFAGLPILDNCMDCHDDSDKQVWEQVEDIMKRVVFEKKNRKI